jgi:hypothetical protein
MKKYIFLRHAVDLRARVRILSISDSLEKREIRTRVRFDKIMKRSLDYSAAHTVKGPSYKNGRDYHTIKY